MPSASRTIPLRGSADLVAGRSDGIPAGAEVVDPLSGGIPGIVICDDVIQRVAAIGDLVRAVVSFRRTKQRGVGSGASLWRGSGQQRRPVFGAVAIACGRRSLVRFGYSGVTYAAVRPPSTRNVAPFT